MEKTINAQYWAKNGTILIPGIGYCFPDRSGKTPEDGCILVKEVTVIEKGNKKYGFYTWEPSSYVDPTEEELITSFMEDPRPEYLSSPVERMTLPNGIAIVLRLRESSWYGGYVYHAISLNGWASHDVSFAGRTLRDAAPYPVEPMFRDSRTMLDLLVKNGYGRATEAEIFTTLRQASIDNLIMPASLEDEDGWLEQTDRLTVIHGGNDYCRIPVLYGIKPQREIEIPAKYSKGAKRMRLSSFIWNYVIEKYHIPSDQMGIPYSHFNKLPLEILSQEERLQLPAAVLKFMDMGFLSVNVMWPDYWVISTNNFMRICLVAEEEELKEILSFAHEEWPRTHREYKTRYQAAQNLEPLAFSYIRGERDGTDTHSKQLNGLVDFGGCEIKRWGNFEYVTSVNEETLILNFNAVEIEALAGEINHLNREAEKHIRSAIAKHRLAPECVTMRRK